MYSQGNPDSSGPGKKVDQEEQSDDRSKPASKSKNQKK